MVLALPLGNAGELTQANPLGGNHIIAIGGDRGVLISWRFGAGEKGNPGLS